MTLKQTFEFSADTFKALSGIADIASNLESTGREELEHAGRVVSELGIRLS